MVYDRIQISLPKPLHEKLEKVAEGLHMTKSGVIQMLIRDYNKSK